MEYEHEILSENKYQKDVYLLKLAFSACRGVAGNLAIKVNLRLCIFMNS